MSRKTVKFIAIFVAIIFAFVFIAIPVISLLEVNAKTQSQLNNELLEAQRQKQSNLLNINRKRAEEQPFLEKKKAIEDDISYLQKDIDDINSVIWQNDAKINELSKEINELESRIEARMDLFKKRAKVMHEKGNISYLEVLLGASSFSDFLSRVSVVTQILNYDKAIMNEIKLVKSDISVKKAEVEKAKGENQEAANRLNAQKSVLVERRNEQQALIDELEKDIAVYTKAYDEAEKKEKQIMQQLASITSQAEKNSGVKYNGVFTWPTPGYYSITSPFGWRIHPLTKTNRYHNGIDIAAPMGAKVVAADKGTISFVGRDSVYGNYLIITHGSVSSMYAHLTSIYVKKGQTVSKGQSIGTVGSTGWSTGPHLHFTVTSGGKDVNPMTYLK